MIDSATTREDRHYWDLLHYTQAIAERLVPQLKIVVDEHRAKADQGRLFRMVVMSVRALARSGDVLL